MKIVADHSYKCVLMRSQKIEPCNKALNLKKIKIYENLSGFMQIDEFHT